MIACSLSLFLYFRSPPPSIAKTKVYIEGFRSKRIQWWWNQRHPRFETQDYMHHVVWLCGPSIFSSLGPSEPTLYHWKRIHISFQAPLT
jgi:hypothetical protein